MGRRDSRSLGQIQSITILAPLRKAFCLNTVFTLAKATELSVWIQKQTDHLRPQINLLACHSCIHETLSGDNPRTHPSLHIISSKKTSQKKQQSLLFKVRIPLTGVKPIVSFPFSQDDGTPVCQWSPATPRSFSSESQDSVKSSGERGSNVRASKKSTRTPKGMLFGWFFIT